MFPSLGGSLCCLEVTGPLWHSRDAQASMDITFPVKYNISKMCRRVFTSREHVRFETNQGVILRPFTYTQVAHTAM